MDKLLGVDQLQFLRNTRTLAPHLNAKRAARALPDVLILGHGSVYLFHLHSDAARDWVRDNVQDDAPYLGRALAVEHRYVAQLAEGMLAAGLSVE